MQVYTNGEKGAAVDCERDGQAMRARETNESEAVFERLKTMNASAEEAKRCVRHQSPASNAVAVVYNKM